MSAERDTDAEATQAAGPGTAPATGPAVPVAAPPPHEPPPADGDRPGGSGGSGEPHWARPFVAVAAAVGLLLLGVAAGLLIGLPGAPPTLAVPPADSVDVGFAQDMTVHHQQAVEMAAWERDHTTDPVLRQLAYDIESTQQAQIGRMQGWLGLWGAAPQHTGGYMAWMQGAPTHGHSPPAAGGGVATMPGMASADDLRRLRAATGPELDVLFLQLMLRHHQGGADMLEYAVEHADVPEVRNLARGMLSSQTSEAQYMTDLLTQRGGRPLPL
jgi:uncharacterized protein (DUF305 family)